MKVVALTSALTAALVILAPVALANDAASSLRLESDIADREIVALIQNCDPSTGLPIGRKGACTGIESFNGSISGGLNASYYSEVNFAVLANGEALTTAFDIITGTADGHGSGSFAVFELCRIATTLELTCRWNVIAGSGTDDLEGIIGGGKIVGTYDPLTGLGAGRFSGVLHFRRR